MLRVSFRRISTYSAEEQGGDGAQPHEPLEITIHVRLAGVLALLMALQIADSFRGGLAIGKASFRSRVEAADILVNFATAPASLITSHLYPDPAIFRARAAIAAKDRLSVFATPDAAAYSAAGIVPGGQVGRMLPIPGPLAFLLQRNGPVSRAWTVLSSLYFARPDLQAAFPQTSEDYIGKLLTWATTYGVTIDGRLRVPTSVSFRQA
jgi:hypothetical protein